jgi:hypothetical protein
VFTVTLSAASSLTATVAYSTSAGSATPGLDYLLANGTLTFAPGVQTLTGTVTVLDDGDVEAPETLTLWLSAPANAVLAAPFSATLTLLSDDLYRLFLPLSLGGLPTAPGNKFPG